MYKAAYDLGGEARATAVMRRHFAEQQQQAGSPAAEAGDGAAAAAPVSSATAAGVESKATRKSAAASPPGQAGRPAPGPAQVADVAALLPAPLGERAPGYMLFAGSTNWEEVGKRTLSFDEACAVSRFSRLLPGRQIAFVCSAPSACHAIAITAEGAAFAWGRNASGQLGLGHTDTVTHPTPVETLDGSRVASAACGKMHTIFLTDRGLLACGSNSYAQLGTGSQAKMGSTVLQPKAVRWPSSAAAPCRVACGADFSVATDVTGRLYSWGHPQYGQLGNGTSGQVLERAGKIDYAFRTEPVLVEVRPPPSQHGGAPVCVGPLACGDHHTVLCSTTGTVYTFGFGGYGRLGHKDQKDRMRATAIDFPHKAKIVDVSAGATCTYAISATRALFFWGRTKSTGEATMYPKGVADLHGWSVRSISCGHSSTVVAADRAVISWGPSPAYGELGYGEAGPKSSTQPKLVDDLDGTRVEQVASGYAFSVLLMSAQDEKSTALLERLPNLGDGSDAAATNTKEPAVGSKRPAENGDSAGNDNGGPDAKEARTAA